MNDERLTPDFCLSEFLQSDTAVRRGIPNQPSSGVLDNLRHWLAPGLQRVRMVLGQPMIITSGFRSAALNAAIGGVPTSQHLTGQAADFIAPKFGSPLEVCRCLVANSKLIGYDQIIQEGSWVHISFSAQPRGEVLTATFSNGVATYSRGVL